MGTNYEMIAIVATVALICIYSLYKKFIKPRLGAGRKAAQEYVKCPNCGHDEEVRIDTCSNCGFVFPESKLRQWVTIIVIMIAGSVLSFAFIDLETTERDQERWLKRDNSIMAYIMTESWVKENLVSPGSAEFPDSFTKRQHTRRMTDQRYRIESYVDSQNQFGAMLRTYFTAEVQQVGESNWQLNSLEFD